MDINKVMQYAYPGVGFSLTNDDYEKLEMADGSEKPSREVLSQKWEEMNTQPAKEETPNENRLRTVINLTEAILRELKALQESGV